MRCPKCKSNNIQQLGVKPDGHGDLVCLDCDWDNLSVLAQKTSSENCYWTVINSNTAIQVLCICKRSVDIAQWDTTVTCLCQRAWHAEYDMVNGEWLRAVLTAGGVRYYAEYSPPEEFIHRKNEASDFSAAVFSMTAHTLFALSVMDNEYQRFARS